MKRSKSGTYIFGLNAVNLKYLLIVLILIYVIIAAFTPHKTVSSLIILIIPVLIFFIIILNANERSYKSSESRKRLYKACDKEINTLEGLMYRLSLLSDKCPPSKVINFRSNLDKFSQAEEYERLLLAISREIIYISALIEIYSEDHNHEENENYSKQKSGKVISRASEKKIAAALLILGLSSETKDLAVVKKQYRRLMMKYHPDKNSNTEAADIAINLNYAYEILKKELN